MNRRTFLRRTLAGVGGASIGATFASGHGVSSDSTPSTSPSTPPGTASSAPASELPEEQCPQASDSTSIFLPTGFTDLDRFIGGVRPGSILAIAGRPSFGKTTLAMNLAMNWWDLRFPVAYFSAPTAYRDTLGDALSYAAKTPRWIGREEVAENGDRINFGPLIDDTPDLSPAQIRCRAVNEVEGLGRSLGAVVVDRPDLLRLDSRHGRERERMAAIMQALRAIALELNVAIVVTSDVGRRVDARHDERPRLSDFHPSMAPIAEAADVVLLLYRDEACHFRSTMPGIVEIEVARNRYGPCGTLWLGFDGAYARFATLDAVADPSGSPGA